MNRIFAIALAFLLLIPSFLSAKILAVLETSVPYNVLTSQEQSFLTAVLQEQASIVLPTEQNWIVVRENGNADYVVQTRVSQFGKNLAISAELFDAFSGKLVASFAGTGETVADLERVIKEQSPSFFKKIEDSSWTGFANNAAQIQGYVLVEIVTTPAGAAPSIDGVIYSECQATPCKVQLDAGSHRFSFLKDDFNELDTLVNVSESNKTINVALSPVVGHLNLVPQLPDEFRRLHAINLTVDGKKAFLGLNNVVPGIHSVHVEHPCFDPIELNTIIEKNETKNIADSLVRGIGALELDVTKNGELLSVPVFIDGNQVGSTPFASDDPLCSKIEIEYAGERREVPVELKWHLVIKKTYELEKKPEVVKQSETVAIAKPDTLLVGNEKHIEVETPAKQESAQQSLKYIWGGLVLGAIYNDFYNTKFGLNSIPQNRNFKLSVDGAEKLLENFWGVGFKGGLGLMFLPNAYFNLRGDLNVAFRQGTGKANTSVIVSWKKESYPEEKSDLKLEYSVTQLNIDVPLLARISIPNSLYFEVGPMCSFNVYSKNEAKITDIYGTETFKEKGGLKVFEFDIATGIGVMRFIGNTLLDIDLRFVLGMTRISDSKDSPKTWQGQLNITYWFL